MNFGQFSSDSLPTPNVGAWQGLTIKEILEKVDLSSIIMDDSDSNKSKANNPLMTNNVDPEAAFLGPKLWTKSVPMPISGENEDFSVMNIDDFLSENGFDLNDPPSPSVSNSSHKSTSEDMDTDSNMEPPMKKKATTVTKRQDSETSFSRGPKSGAASQKMDNTFLYVESKRARMEREKEERQRKRMAEIEFTPQDLALATVPGMDFDPRERSFAPDELRPQPIIRKRKKSFVPSESKDDKYWEKREKNNVAARRSREARRLKENQIALRTAYLERENATLKASLDEVKAINAELIAEKQTLLNKLRKYEN